MDKNLYIDASHPDETRIVLKSNLTIEEYEYEDKNRVNFKNNIYLGTISRVEPSLQAAFVDFGRIKHGFLAFNDIQSDYYQIPSADKEKLKTVEEKIPPLTEKIIKEAEDTLVLKEEVKENEKKIKRKEAIEPSGKERWSTSCPDSKGLFRNSWYGPYSPCRTSSTAQ